MPAVYLPRGGLITTTEDSDIVLEGLAIAEMDGVYNEGEMEGANVIDSMETPSTAGRSWRGKVNFFPAIDRMEACHSVIKNMHQLLLTPASARAFVEVLSVDCLHAPTLVSSL